MQIILLTAEASYFDSLTCFAWRLGDVSSSNLEEAAVVEETPQGLHLLWPAL